MNNHWKLPDASIIGRWLLKQQSNLGWIVGGGASFALLLMSCSTSRTMMVPPSIPGATFIGTETCGECHDKIVRDFRTASHAKLQAKGDNAKDMGCESCHGPGSKHQESGGAAGTIVNPKKSPDTCFQCHLDKKAEFTMPFAHPVLSGKMSCGDCHDPHKGDAIKGGGTQLAGRNETCAECHKAQSGPFVFAHDAVREGCTSCHSPHGSVNPKMLTERNATLCLKCHFDVGTTKGDPLLDPSGSTMGASGNHASGRFQQGTCWSAGCHEAVHGSNTNVQLRF